MDDKEFNETILLVEPDKFVNDIYLQVLSKYYNVYNSPSLQSLSSILPAVSPDLIMIDLGTIKEKYKKILKDLIKVNNINHIPTLYLVNNDTCIKWLRKEILSFNSDVLLYPVSPTDLLTTIRTYLTIGKRDMELEKTNISVDKMLALAFSNLNNTKRNDLVFVVEQLVTFYNLLVGEFISRSLRHYIDLMWLRLIKLDEYKAYLNRWTYNTITISQLYDIGKIGISEFIINKPDRLNDTDWSTMVDHIYIGLKILDCIDNAGNYDRELMYQAKLFIRDHHERWDGSGYPNKLIGPEISLEGRIMAIVDCYNALTSVRRYKEEPMTHEFAVKIIQEGSGTKFDPNIVDVFLEIAPLFKEFLTREYDEEDKILSMV